jgi:hypothetical protein
MRRGGVMRKVRKVKKVAAILGGVASVGAVAIGSVGLASVGFSSDPAHAAPPGYTSSVVSQTCQGNSPNCKTPKHDNNGTVEVTTAITGPKGALKNGNTPDDRVEITVVECGPGKGKC